MSIEKLRKKLEFYASLGFVLNISLEDSTKDEMQAEYDRYLQTMEKEWDSLNW